MDMTATISKISNQGTRFMEPIVTDEKKNHAADYAITYNLLYMDDPSITTVTEDFELMFYNTRFYDPAIGRFTSAHSIIPKELSMVVKHIKSFWTWYVLLGLLLCLLGGLGLLKRYQMTTDCYKDRAPLKSIVATIDVNQHEQLFEQFRKFADQYDFAIQIRPTSPNGFIVVMSREDIEVIAWNPRAWGEYKIRFYNNDCIYPTVASDLDGLASDLKGLISEIPNVTITEEK